MERFIRGVLLAAAVLLVAASAPGHPGTGIAVDASGRVSFTNLKSVWRWEPGGRLTEIVPAVHTHALRLERDGALVGEDLHYDSARGRWLTALWRLSPEGHLSRGPASDESPFDSSAAVGADGSIYFSRVDNNRRDISEIYRQRPDGRKELLAGGAYGYADGVAKAARFGPIGALAVGPDGIVYATDAPAIRRITPDGRVTTLARGGQLLKPTLVSRLMGGRFGHLMGIALDAAGNVFVANCGGGRVVKVTPAGAVTSVLESEGTWAPTGVTLARGDLYVLEWGGAAGVRVRRVSARGEVTVLAIVH
jgi:sugar lactone lactonase YvrE